VVYLQKFTEEVVNKKEIIVLFNGCMNTVLGAGLYVT